MASFHCLGLSFCIKCGGARQLTFINAVVIVESLGSFRTSLMKFVSSRFLPWKLDQTLNVISTFGSRRVLCLFNGPRFNSKKRGQSTLDLFPLFGLMLSEPDIHPTTVSICISTYLNFFNIQIIVNFFNKNYLLVSGSVFCT